MRAGLVVLVCGLLGLAGCSGGAFSAANPAAGAEVSGVKLTGTVHGGQNPITGANVYLFAANTTGYGGSGLAASSGNASVSLLTSAVFTNNPLNSGEDGNGNYYVTTDANGNFSITGDYTCTAGQQVYLYALGGNPGLGTGTNPAAGLLAALGSCPTGGNFLSGTSPISYVVMNEVSTIATAYAFAGFATDATHVGDDEAVPGNNFAAQARAGMANAFANAANLETLGTGVALATTPAGNGTVPQAEINTLANILAACVNSNGTGPACTTLFANAESGGSTGTQPTDTATAAINMAHNPGANVAALYGLSTGNPPFAGGLSAQPNDFTVALNFTGGGINSPMAVAIDSAGNAWVSNRFSGASVNSGAGSVTEISSVGSFLSGPNGYTAVASGSTYGGVYYPFDLAVDRSGNAWIANFEGSGVTEISSSGATISPPYGYPPSGNPTGALGGSTGVAVDGLGDIWVVGFDDNVAKLSGSGSAISPVGASGLNGYTGGGLVFPFGVAIDGSGDAWIANTTSGTGGVTEFSRTGSVLSGATGYTGGGLDGPRGIAIDSSGNAWVTNYNGTNAVTEISNAGTILFAAGLGNDVVSPEGVAIDGSGSVWVTSYARSLIAELSNTGATLSSALPGYAWGVGYLLPGATQGVAYGSVGVAVDGSGDVWIAGSAINTVAEFIGAATPVITPIAAGLPATPTANGTSNLGTRP